MAQVNVLKDSGKSDEGSMALVFASTHMAGIVRAIHEPGRISIVIPCEANAEHCFRMTMVRKMTKRKHI